MVGAYATTTFKGLSHNGGADILVGQMAGRIACPTKVLFEAPSLPSALGRASLSYEFI